MSRVQTIHYAIPDLQKAKDFYCAILGMVEQKPDQENINSVCMGYAGRSFGESVLQFSKCVSESDTETRSVYWKIGLTMPDVDLAIKALSSHDVTTGSASQFKDIGFLAHLKDRCGLTIEMLQHSFQNNFQPSTPKHDLALWQQPIRIGQVTLRVHDIEANLKFYRDLLGLKLLSIQAVTEYGFTLYFLGPANLYDDKQYELEDSAIREDLWRYPHTTIELQHVKDKLTFQNSDAFRGLTIYVDDEHYVKLPENAMQGTHMKDPQGIPVYIRHDSK